MRRLRPVAAGIFSAAVAFAQPVELENFSATGATGAVRPESTWVGNVQRLTDTIVVGGTAKDDNGWGGTSAGLDLSAMRFVTITGQRNASHDAPFVVLELRDANLNPHVVSVSSAQFSSTPTAVEVPLGTWSAGFNPAQVREWTIGGGTVGLLPFRMTLDHISFAAFGSAVAPVITAQPVDLLVASGGGATFTVAAAGASSYRWFFGGTAILGATSATLQLSAVTASSAGEYFAEVVNSYGVTSSRRAVLQVVDLQAAHRIADGGPAGYSAGSAITFSSTISYSGQPGTVALQVLLPANWQLVAQTSQATSSPPPKTGDSGLLVWSWTSLPPSPINVTYMVSVNPETLGPKSITAQIQVINGGLTGFLQAKPDPLIVSMAPRPHSADLNGDYRIGLIELTRVIELYNTRNAGLSRRTGAYLPDVTGEDGFAANPSATGAGKISRYHDADTSRDAQISLIELTRVIEIYNQRAGAVRTGEYRVSSGTEDGFAPGP